MFVYRLKTHKTKKKFKKNFNTLSVCWILMQREPEKGYSCDFCHFGKKWLVNIFIFSWGKSALPVVLDITWFTSLTKSGGEWLGDTCFNCNALHSCVLRPPCVQAYTRIRTYRVSALCQISWKKYTFLKKKNDLKKIRARWQLSFKKTMENNT